MSVEEFIRRLKAIKITGIKIFRSRNQIRKTDDVDTAVRHSIWPRVTFELDGKIKTVSFPRGTGTTVWVSSNKMADDNYVGIAILRLVVGRTTNVNISSGSRKYWNLVETTANIRSKIQRRVIQASKTKSLLERTQKDIRSKIREDARAEVRETLSRKYHALRRQDIIDIWDEIAKEKTIAHVMDA